MSPTPTRTAFTSNLAHYATFHSTGANPDFPDCVICTRPYGPKRKRLHLLDCEHDFCTPCFKTWINSEQHAANLCPMCRKVLFVPDHVPDDDNEEHSVSIGPSWALMNSYWYLTRDADSDTERLEPLSWEEQVKRVREVAADIWDTGRWVWFFVRLWDLGEVKDLLKEARRRRRSYAGSQYRRELRHRRGLERLRGDEYYVIESQW
ncbi:hypothetical protein BU16DRAFT_542667 [Lophium mytilinum]|uniref:RING-type domain-containing protein n=1 Tax=Lophium mytilinum TaxID=390894 RepID=A0A6A6QGM2_9PEZI|nr:hypothetical protein BU16DRAFT_542667 [Lophium mytilinum]